MELARKIKASFISGEAWCLTVYKQGSQSDWNVIIQIHASLIKLTQSQLF